MKEVLFKPKVLKPLPDALRDMPLLESDDIKPSPVAVARVMFGGPAVEPVPRRKKTPVVPTLAVPTAMAPTMPERPAKRPRPAEAEAEVPTEAETTAEAEAEVPTEADFTPLSPDMREMAQLILQEEEQNLYSTAVPKTYVPASRRGFSRFIKTTYKTFQLPAGPIEIPETEKYYPYQKFVRDYMRQESPYRGILVYHGLGSGKTCTSIATAEALYASANKKIIVMAPKSLKNNYFREISFCGFRHFQLKNFWVKLDPADATTAIFANQVLGLPGRYLTTAKHIWVPDFRKTPAESNYDRLTDEEREEIRAQILSIVEWHPEKNPTGRIRFISYNGITAEKLIKMACADAEGSTAERFFDNAVVIIDEIHNLVRNITGKIEPYFKDVPTRGGKKLRRVIPVEPMRAEGWRPSVCDPKTKIYTRSYLFYRMLTEAKNCKIVGLSGTPLINFPEEIGVMMNILHGPVLMGRANVQQSGDAAKKLITETGFKNKYIDFINASLDSSEGMRGGFEVVFSLLPPGVRKLSHTEGVERITPEEPMPTLEEIVAGIKGEFAEAGVPFRGGAVELSAHPLLPPFRDDFAKAFMKNGTITSGEMVNENVLIKRITGLVSYYKGSRLELMPRIKVDEIVRVPFSLYAQKAYSLRRAEEVEREAEKIKKGAEKGAKIDKVLAKVYQLGDTAESSNYMMGSRQACNFAFPPGVARPMPQNAREVTEEAQRGVAEAIDTLPADGLTTREEKAAALAGPDMEAEAEEKAEEAAAAAEDAEIARETGIRGDEIEGEEAAQEGGGLDGEGEPDFSDVSQEGGDGEEDEAVAAAAPAKAKPGGVKAALLKQAEDCKGGRKPGEKITDAYARARRCLRTIARKNMRLGDPDGLELYSPKYAAMLGKIAEARGSSLVYSQFLDMEGIGIFRVAMDVNGYAPIQIIPSGGGGFTFSPETEASLRKGPGAQPRYMTFSGGESDEIRALSLNIFNAKFAELPEQMNKILTESGYTDNKRGEICRVFCITSAGAEGLSLRNVRAVHIMEPYWNEVRLRQVKGRAIRIGSHLDLPEAERDVSIYTYVSCFSEEAQSGKNEEYRIDGSISMSDVQTLDAETAKGLGIRGTALGAASTKGIVLTTDEMLQMVALKKKKLLGTLEGIMKSAAVDCELNIEQNKGEGFECLPLRGNVGDFLYHPLLNEDIKLAMRVRRGEGAPGAATQAPQARGAEEEERGLAGLPMRRFVAAPPEPPLAELVAAQAAAPTDAVPAEEEFAVDPEELARKKAMERLAQHVRAFYKEVKASEAQIDKVDDLVEKYKGGIWAGLEKKFPADVVKKHAAAWKAGSAPIEPEPEAVAPPAPAPREFFQAYKGKEYKVREKLDADGNPVGFDMIFPKISTTVVGEAAYNPATKKPKPPVTFIEGYVP